MSAVTPMAPTPIAAVAPRRRARRRLRKAGWNLLGLLVLLVMIFPVYWMVATAFKPGQRILSYTPQWFPTDATFANFTEAIHRAFFWDAVKNSLIVVGSVVGLAICIAFLAALALAAGVGVHELRDGAAIAGQQPAAHQFIAQRTKLGRF